jgi:hypothetical protein
MAFDYSGRCGAPAMVVIVDQIQGGRERLWTWQLPGALFSDDQTSSESVQIDGNSFTLHYSDASMHATFITPADSQIEHARESIQVGDPRHGFHGQVNRIKVPGKGSFFVVMTFQRGKPPKVNIEGSGLDARVKVGNRVIGFDRSRIVLSE